MFSGFWAEVDSGRDNFCLEDEQSTVATTIVAFYSYVRNKSNMYLLEQSHGFNLKWLQGLLTKTHSFEEENVEYEETMCKVIYLTIH